MQISKDDVGFKKISCSDQTFNSSNNILAPSTYEIPQARNLIYAYLSQTRLYLIESDQISCQFLIFAFCYGLFPFPQFFLSFPFNNQHLVFPYLFSVSVPFVSLVFSVEIPHRRFLTICKFMSLICIYTEIVSIHHSLSVLIQKMVSVFLPALLT